MISPVNKKAPVGPKRKKTAGGNSSCLMGSQSTPEKLGGGGAGHVSRTGNTTPDVAPKTVKSGGGPGYHGGSVDGSFMHAFQAAAEAARAEVDEG